MVVLTNELDDKNRETTFVSIIICTYGRPNILSNLLKDLNSQTYPKDLYEIIIVDQTPNDSVRRVINSINLNANIKYIDAKSYLASLTISRNLGVKNTNKNSKIIVFLDDDVRVKNIFIQQLVNYFNVLNAWAIGKIHIKNKEYLVPKIINKIFHRYHYKGIVLKWWKAEPVISNSIEAVQWIGGYCMSYRKEVFKYISFDEKLKRWSYFEDVDFSYRVYKKFGGVYSVPNLNCVHLETESGRMPKDFEIAMRLAYKIYFFNKYYPQHTFYSTLMFIWSFIGDIIQIGFHRLGCYKDIKSVFKNLIHLAKSLVYVFSNFSKIKTGKDKKLFNVNK